LAVELLTADLDRDVFIWVVEHRAPPLDWLFVGLSVAGSGGLLWIGLAALLAYLARRPVLATTAITAATVWSADLLTAVLKRIVDRDRPYAVLPEAEPLLRWDVSASFPSGHAATSAAGAVILAYLLGRWGWGLAALAAAVAYARVYIGVHYPLDVLAGAAIGAAVALTAAALLRRLRPTSGARRRSAGATPGG
jgi:undecaprenyl-diphosphatase